METRQRTAMEVMAWFWDPVRSSALTWAEMRSIASLRHQSWVVEAGAGATDPRTDRGGGGSGG